MDYERICENIEKITVARQNGDEDGERRARSDVEYLVNNEIAQKGFVWFFGSLLVISVVLTAFLVATDRAYLIEKEWWLIAIVIFGGAIGAAFFGQGVAKRKLIGLYGQYMPKS